jgi:hypothetical protein
MDVRENNQEPHDTASIEPHQGAGHSVESQQTQIHPHTEAQQQTNVHLDYEAQHHTVNPGHTGESKSSTVDPQHDITPDNISCQHDVDSSLHTDDLDDVLAVARDIGLYDTEGQRVLQVSIQLLKSEIFDLVIRNKHMLLLEPVNF